MSAATITPPPPQEQDDNQQPQEPLNDLVTKWRAKYPGSYDHIDDATLTKKILDKYPVYSPLAAPKLTVGSPSNIKVKSPDTEVNQGLITAETKLADIPKGVAHLASSKYWPVVDSHNFSELGRDLKSLNPIDTHEGNLAMNIGGTAANILPFAIDGEGIGESPLGKTASAAAKIVPKVARTAAEVAKPAGIFAEDLPVIGSAIKAAKSVPKAASGVRDIWSSPKEAPAVYPGAHLPATPIGAELNTIPVTPARSGAETGEALGTIKPKAAHTIPQPKATVTGIANKVEEALGGKKLEPNVPLRQQLPNAPKDVPEGHTPATSSAVKSYKYDPQAKEFHARLNSGDTTYVYGDVSAEEAREFEQAQSKGKALQKIKANPLVAKIVNGERRSTRPATSRAMAAD